MCRWSPFRHEGKYGLNWLLESKVVQENKIKKVKWEVHDSQYVRCIFFGRMSEVTCFDVLFQVLEQYSMWHFPTPAPFDPSPASYDKVGPAIGRCFAIQGRKCRPTRVVVATVHLQRSGNSDSSGCDIYVVDVRCRYIYVDNNGYPSRIEGILKLETETWAIRFCADTCSACISWSWMDKEKQILEQLSCLRYDLESV